MAVEDKYVNALYVGSIASKMLPAINATGCELSFIRETVSVLAADSDNSKYRVFKGLSPNIIPVEILVANTAITAGTSYDLGLYQTDLGVVADADCFAAAMDMSAAALLPIAGTAKNGMAAVSLSNYNKRLWEHAGVTDVKNRPGAYDLVLTANTVGTVDGTITVSMYFVQAG